MEEKQYPATEHRRQQFALDGRVPKSRDLQELLLLTLAVLMLVAFGGYGVDAVSQYTRVVLRDLNRGIDADLLRTSVRTFLIATLPVMLGALFGGIGVGVLQNGFKFDLKFIKLDFTKLNPAPRLKEMFFSVAALAKVALTFLKVLAVVGVCWWTLKDAMPEQLMLEPVSWMQSWANYSPIMATLMIRVFLVWALVAIADFQVNKFQLDREMRMSYVEVREEQKQLDGDPQMRAMRKRRARDRMRWSLETMVPKAEVVVANPTHYAVALAYSEEIGAPRVIAKGADHQAARIRTIARRAGVPIVVQPPLARDLYRRVRVGRTIPENSYHAVALVLAYVYRARRRVA